MGNATWHQHTLAAGRHLMAMHRLEERLSAITGVPPLPPFDITDGERSTWIALIRESESAAREHGDALAVCTTP